MLKKSLLILKGLLAFLFFVNSLNLDAQANAGLDQVGCTSSFALAGNSPGPGTTGQWTVVAGSAIFANPSVSVTIAVVGIGSNILRWTVDNGGTITSDDVTIRNDEVIANAGPDRTICTNFETLSASNPTLTQGTGQWSDLSGTPANIINNSLYNSFVNNLQVGTTTFRWTVSNGACQQVDDVIITNNQVTASATGFMTCNNNTAITADNNPILQGATGVWTVDNQSTQSIAAPNSYITTVSGLIPNALNRLRWTVTNGICSASDTLNLEYFVPNANIIIPDIVHGCSDNNQLMADPNIGTGVGIWTESTGNSMITFDNNSLATTFARNLPIGNNTFIWTVSNRGCVSSDQVLINNSKPINVVGSDQALCNNTFTMNAQIPTATGSGLWSLISGTASFTNPALATSTVTVAPGTSLLQWTITDKGCSTSKQFNITNNLTYPNAGTDLTVCENQVQLSGNSLKLGETGLWTIDGGIMSEVFSSTSVNNPIVTNLRQGYLTFAWTISNGLCTATDRMVVINNNPTVDAGPDRVICDDFITLAGNNLDPGSTGFWTIEKPDVIIANPGSYNTNITNLAVGDNLFIWTINNQGCIKSDEVIITRETIDVVAGAPHTEACSSTLDLNATVPPANCHGYWTSVEGGATFDNPTSYTTVARNLDGINKLRWTIVYGSCRFFDDIEFVNLIPTIANTIEDKSVCYNSTQITANPANGAGELGLWTKVVGSSNVTIVNPTSFQSLVNNLDFGSNTFKWTISNSSCSTFDLITITNDEVFANAGIDHTICDSIYSISANVTPGSGIWITTTPGVIIANNTLANTAVSQLWFGNNNFQWHVNYNGCTDIDEVIITSNLPRYVSAGPDQIACSGPVYLTGTNPGAGTGLWQITGGAGTFTNPSLSQTVVSGLSSGGNIFKWTVTYGGCSAYDQVMINNNFFPVFAGSNQTICNVNSLQLDGAIPGSGKTGAWSVNGGFGNFDNGSVYNTIVRNPTKGTNTYRWTLTDGICTNFDDMEVINNSPDAALVGLDQIICTDNTTINAVAVANGTGSWSVSSGSAAILSPSLNNTNVTGINKGINTFTWTVNKFGCKLLDDINVTNSSVDVIANADIVICTSTHDATIIGNLPAIGETGTWTKISAGPGVITNSTNNISAITGLGNGETFFRWTVANASCSAYDDVKITDNYYNTTAQAHGYNNCVNYSFIQGGSLPYGATGLWTSTASNVTFDSNSSNLTWARNLPDETSTLTWAVTKDGCSSPASFSLLNNSIYTNAGLDQLVCQTSTTLNAQTLLPGESGVWTADNSMAIIANISETNSSVSNLISGNNTFTWTLYGKGCTVSDQVILSNNTISVIDAGQDAISCGTFYNLIASEPVGGAGLWTINSGTGNFTNASSFVTTVSNLSNGPNTFNWTVNRDGCSAFDNVVITNDLYVATAGADKSLCSNQTTVTAQPLNPIWGASGMWSAQTGGGVFASPTQASSLITGLANGDNRIRWTVTKGVCQSFDEMIITNNSITATGGINETTCNTFTTLSATPLSPTAVGLWSGGGVTTTIVSPASPTTMVNNLQQGTNTFAWTVTDKGCTGSSTVQIVSNYFIPVAGNDQTKTVDYTVMTAQLPNGAATGNWSTFSGRGTFTNSNAQNSTVTNLDYGISIFRWTVDWNNCSAFDDVNILYDAITANAGPNQNICTGSTNLKASDPFPGQGKWTLMAGNGVFANALSQSTEVTEIMVNYGNIYRWTVTTNGYSESDDVTIMNPQIIANAGADADIVNISQYTLDGNAPLTGSGIWTSLSPSILFDDISLSNALASNIPNGSSTFTWTITNECGISSDDVVITKVVSGIETISSNGIKLYPNPTKGEINIEFENIKGYKDLIITNLSGQKILQKNITKNKESIDLSKLGKGMYLIQIQHNDEIIRTKIIIQD